MTLTFFFFFGQTVLWQKLPAEGDKGPDIVGFCPSAPVIIDDTDLR